MANERFESDAARIYEQWHQLARNGDVEGALALYAPDAILESPLVPAILGREDGRLRGHSELRAFFEQGVRRRPNELVRWYRTGKYSWDGHTLIWEYPREAPDGSQIDIVELMEIEEGLIRHHRIYWGWFGTTMLVRSALSKRNG